MHPAVSQQQRHPGAAAARDPFADEAAWYGSSQRPLAAGAKDWPALERGRRQRLNLCAMLLCLLVPVLLFAGVSAACSFSLRYHSPPLAWALVLLGLFGVLCAGVGVFEQRRRSLRVAPAQREPSWLGFLFLSVCLAWLLAVALGCYNFKHHISRYYDSRTLNQYVDVRPDQIHGQQVMDAGIINFASGSHLNISQSMGFRHMGMYCVAPIVIGDVKLATYDFWAVGKDCCTGAKADFHCQGYNDPHALGGLRSMDAGAAGYFRLAVQQAEATYDIKAFHPLFFHWVEDAVAMTEGWRDGGRQLYRQGVLAFGVFQAFLVAVAALAFSRLA